MSDPIDALTQIIQQHTGCYSDDRPRERCLVHGTGWPCEQLGAFVAEVQSWHEAQPYPHEAAPEAARPIIHKGYVPDYDHAAWDEQPGPTCETDRENCDIADEPCCQTCRDGEHGMIDEETDACLCCGESLFAIREAEARAQYDGVPIICPNGPDCEMSQEPTHRGGEKIVCLTHEGDHP